MNRPRLHPGYSLDTLQDTPWIHIGYTPQIHPGYVILSHFGEYTGLVRHVGCIYGFVGYTSDISQIHPLIHSRYSSDNPIYTPDTPDRGLGVSRLYLVCLGAYGVYPGVHVGCI